MKSISKETQLPPKLATWLLRRIYDDDLFDDVAGDLQEMYVDRLSARGKWIASLHYFKDVLLSFRNIDLKKKAGRVPGNRTVLFKNYFKMTFRTIGRNQVYSGLNILGLALGMAAFLFIIQYVSYEKSYDSFHINQAELYRIQYKSYDASGVLIKNCAAIAPRVAPYMKENMPEVRSFARVMAWRALVYSYGNNKFREDGTKIVDPDFLQLFTFPLVEGDPKTALTEINSLIISERMAKKYFGDEPAVGKIMDIDGYKDYKITGVARAVPENSHIKFDFLLSYATVQFWRGEDVQTSWDWYDFHSYVLLRPGTNPHSLERKFEDVFEKDVRGRMNRERKVKEQFLLQPITEIHLYSHLTKELAPEEQGDGDVVAFLTVISFFILLIAWINYINLSTARSIERAKEVGVRKTIGAYRSQLIGQFMAESVVMNFLALIIGLMIVISGIHYFNLVTNAKLDLNFLTDQLFWIRVVVAFTFGSLVSGLYPAFVLSSFQPMAVLKGKFSANPSGVLLRRVLVAFQFAASVMLIAGTSIVYLQLKYMRTSNLGFDITKTIVIRGPNPVGEENEPKFERHSTTFKNELLRLPNVKAVASSSNVPGDEIKYWRAIGRVRGQATEYILAFTIEVDHNYFATYDIKVIEGRAFDTEFVRDSATLIINATAVRTLGFESPQSAIGQSVIFGDESRVVVGVVDDYNQMSVKKAVVPLTFELNPAAYEYYTVKLAQRDFQASLPKMKSLYESFYPKAPFDYFFLDDFYDRQYNNERKFSNVFTLFAGFSIFVACLGLFGLSSFNALQRTKEIGIRKVLGADATNIVFLLSREFVALVIVGTLIAWPISYFVMKDWLSHFASRIKLGFPIFLISGLTVVLIAILTVGYRTITTARSNPIHALKYE